MEAPRASGVEVRWLSIFDGLDRIDVSCKGARMLAISYVQYLSGYRVNLESIGEICSRQGCLFLSMPFRGWVAFPIDVRAAKIDALAADGHKWLLGPEGCGVLYVRQECRMRSSPRESGRPVPELPGGVRNAHGEKEIDRKLSIRSIRSCSEFSHSYRPASGRSVMSREA